MFFSKVSVCFLFWDDSVALSAPFRTTLRHTLRAVAHWIAIDCFTSLIDNGRGQSSTRAGMICLTFLEIHEEIWYLFYHGMAAGPVGLNEMSTNSYQGCGYLSCNSMMWFVFLNCSSLAFFENAFAKKQKCKEIRTNLQYHQEMSLCGTIFMRYNVK